MMNTYGTLEQGSVKDKAPAVEEIQLDSLVYAFQLLLGVVLEEVVLEVAAAFKPLQPLLQYLLRQVVARLYAKCNVPLPSPQLVVPHLPEERQVTWLSCSRSADSDSPLLPALSVLYHPHPLQGDVVKFGAAEEGVLDARTVVAVGICEVPAEEGGILLVVAEELVVVLVGLEHGLQLLSLNFEDLSYLLDFVYKLLRKVAEHAEQAEYFALFFRLHSHQVFPHFGIWVYPRPQTHEDAGSQVASWEWQSLALQEHLAVHKLADLLLATQAKALEELQIIDQVQTNSDQQLPTNLLFQVADDLREFHCIQSPSCFNVRFYAVKYYRTKVIRKALFVRIYEIAGHPHLFVELLTLPAHVCDNAGNRTQVVGEEHAADQLNQGDDRSFVIVLSLEISIAHRHEGSHAEVIAPDKPLEPLFGIDAVDLLPRAGRVQFGHRVEDDGHKVNKNQIHYQK